MGKASVKSEKDGPDNKLQTSIIGIVIVMINFDIELSADSSRILHLTHRIPTKTKKVKINICCKITKNCSIKKPPRILKDPFLTKHVKTG